MTNIGEKAISILVGNSNSGLSYLITTVQMALFVAVKSDCDNVNQAKSIFGSN